MRFDLFLKQNLVFFLRRDKKINSLEEKIFLSLPRTFWQEIIKNGYIKYSKKKLKPSSQSNLLEKSLLIFNWKKIKKSWLLFYRDRHLPYPLPIKFIRKDKAFYALNKPAGITINSISPGKKTSRRPSLLEGLLASKFEEINKIKIVHRLDKETSGVILFARQKESESYLREQFKTKKIKKKYLALVSGKFPHSKFVLSGFMGKKASNPLLRAISTLNISIGSKVTEATKRIKLINSKEATTLGKKIVTGNFEKLSKYPNPILRQWLFLLQSFMTKEQKKTILFSLIELEPKTGRTHQLRVQLSFLGYPIVGDSLYGGLFAQKLDCHCLHALEIQWLNRRKKGIKIASSQIILSKNYFVIE